MTQTHAGRGHASPHNGRRAKAALATIALSAVTLLGLFDWVLSVRSGAGTGEGNALKQGLYVLALLIAMASTQPTKLPRGLLVLPYSMLALLIWCVASMIWSIDPGVTLRRLMLTIFVIWSIFLAVETAGYERSVAIFRIVLIGSVALSLIAVFAMPEIGKHQTDTATDPGITGAWRGVLGQKNYAGAVAATTILLFLFDARKISKPAAWTAIGMALALLLGSHSKTSLAIAVGAIVAGWGLARYRDIFRLFFVPLLAVVVVAISLVIGSRWDSFANGIIKDQDAFTGRGHIWVPVARFVGDHPMFGAGYGAFWNVGGGREPIHQYTTGWVTSDAASAHNGYLEILAQLGIPGLILTVLAFLLLPIIRLVITERLPRGPVALIIAILLFCMGHNLTESSFLERGIIVHVILVFAVALAHQVARGRYQPGPLRGTA
jgi:O-antigen ligase